MSGSSARAARYNLTEGPIVGKLLLVALPIMGTQLMQMTYNLTDMFWLGRLGSAAVAASGTAGLYLWLSQAFIMLARMGAEIGVSQHTGRGEPGQARRFAQSALFLGLVLGLLYGGALVLFSEPCIAFFAIKEPGLAADAAAYLRAVGFGIPAVFVTSAVTGSFNASGNARVPFLINSAGLLINMVLDPVMIFTLDLGITGAALATVIGQAAVCTLSLWAMKRHRDRPFAEIAFFAKPDAAVIRQIWVWCVPIGLESMLFTFLSMVISRFVAGWGGEAIATQRVGSQIESLSWLLGAGLGSAFTTFVGQNYGAGRFSRIRRGYRLSSLVGVLWGALVSLLLFFAGGALCGIFVNGAAVVAMGASYMRILALCQIPSGIESISSGAFKGMGKTLPPTIVSVSCNALRVPLSYFLSLTPLGLDGIWVGLTVGATLRGLGMFCWYRFAARGLPKEDMPA